MKKYSIILLLSSVLLSAQVNNSKPVVYKSYENYLTDYRTGSYHIKEYLPKFAIGQILDNSIMSEKPEVEYNKKFDYYEYVYRLDDANFILWVKNGRIIRKQFIVYNLNDYHYLFDFFDVKTKSFKSGKGFAYNDEQFLVVSKLRHDAYDSFTFDFRGLEFYNLVDLANSD